MQNAPDAPAADLEEFEREQWPVEARLCKSLLLLSTGAVVCPVMILGEELLELQSFD
jgi:hypothetical protein